MNESNQMKITYSTPCMSSKNGDVKAVGNLLEI